MQVRHNTALLEQALEHVVKRASIPLLQAEANALERTNRSFAIRRVATGVAVAIAAVGIGFALYLILPYFLGNALPPIIAQGPDPIPPERKPPQPGPKEPENGPKIDPIPSPLPKEHVVKFKNIEIQLAGKGWLVSAGHHFESAADETWRNAWCYTVTRPKGVEVRVQLADRANPASRPSAPISGLETLEAASLSVPEAFALASKCAWLNRTFAVNELEATSHARNPFPKEPLKTELTNRVLKVSGTIDQQLLAAVRSHDFDVLEINSTGGIIEDAMRVGRQLRRQEKDVRVSGSCLSACVLVLSGGLYRDAASTARVGVHRFRGLQTTDKDIEIGQQKSSEIITYLRDMGIEIDLFQAAASVSSDDMSYLSRPDMEKWKLLNGPRPVPSPPTPSQDQNSTMMPKPLPNGRMEISSKAGWTLSFSPELLALDPDVSDKFDEKEQIWDTNLRSVQHLPEGIVFIQVSVKKLCRDPQTYVTDQIYPKRDRSQVTRSEPRGIETHTSYIIEGRGVAVAPNTFDRRGYSDWVAMRRGDQSTIIHVGGKFPADSANAYREEIRSILNSFKYPTKDPFNKKCVS